MLLRCLLLQKLGSTRERWYDEIFYCNFKRLRIVMHLQNRYTYTRMYIQGLLIWQIWELFMLTDMGKFSRIVTSSIMKCFERTKFLLDLNVKMLNNHFFLHNKYFLKFIACLDFNLLNVSHIRIFRNWSNILNKIYFLNF